HSTTEDKEFFLPSLPISNLSLEKPISPSIFENPPEYPPEPIPQETTNSTLENVRFGKGKVFTKKKIDAPESGRVQESNPNPENELSCSAEQPPMKKPEADDSLFSWQGAVKQSYFSLAVWAHYS
ncbi:unnamed protein product, partial [Dovyalis caffra]